MTSRKKYYELKAAGLCVKCSKPVGESPSKIKCKECHSGVSVKPKAIKCIHCNEADAITNHSCANCHAKTVEIKDKLTSKPLSILVEVPEGICRVCSETIDSIGLICDECLRNTTFTKEDAFACYQAKCCQCQLEDTSCLRFISSNIDKPMSKTGADLYKAICFSKRKLPDYTIACHACYREMCVDYIHEIREFFDTANQDQEDIDMIDI